MLSGLRDIINQFTDLSAAAFHPDGALLALASPGVVTIYNTHSLEFAASFNLPTSGPINSLTFSENGIWFAAASGNSIIIFDLRKTGDEAVLKTFESSAEVKDVAFDYSGQYLASVGSAGVDIRAYKKKEKKWDESLSVAVPGDGIAWGSEAGEVVVVNGQGVVSTIGTLA